MSVGDVVRATVRFRRRCRPTLHGYAIHDLYRHLRGSREGVRVTTGLASLRGLPLGLDLEIIS